MMQQHKTNHCFNHESDSYMYYYKHNLNIIAIISQNTLKCLIDSKNKILNVLPTVSVYQLLTSIRDIYTRGFV